MLVTFRCANCQWVNLFAKTVKKNEGAHFVYCPGHPDILHIPTPLLIMNHFEQRTCLFISVHLNTMYSDTRVNNFSVLAFYIVHAS